MAGDEINKIHVSGFTKSIHALSRIGVGRVARPLAASRYMRSGRSGYPVWAASVRVADCITVIRVLNFSPGRFRCLLHRHLQLCHSVTGYRQFDSPHPLCHDAGCCHLGFIRNYVLSDCAAHPYGRTAFVRSSVPVSGGPYDSGLSQGYIHSRTSMEYENPSEDQFGQRNTETSSASETETSRR